MAKLLLLSNSTMPGNPFFGWALPHVQKFISGVEGYVAFVPYAGLSISYDNYAQKLKGAWQELGVEIRSVHEDGNPASVINGASIIAVGGGNTFALLSMIYQEGLLELIRQRVMQGIPYIGWSAGSNLACPTIKTTNDMPIVQPPAFDALNLIPFQINPHYTELTIAGHGGESRMDRIKEFLVINEMNVLGLPEGMLLERNAEQLYLKGKGSAAHFKIGGELTYYQDETDLSFLLKN